MIENTKIRGGKNKRHKKREEYTKDEIEKLGKSCSVKEKRSDAKFREIPAKN